MLIFVLSVLYNQTKDESMQNKQANPNPFLYLFSIRYKYAQDDKRKVVLFTAMFIVAELFHTFYQPFIWAKMMQILQLEGLTNHSFNTMLGLLVLSFMNTPIFWVIHGPARVLERVTSFKVRVNHRKHLLSGVMTLPMEWHTDHHSGDTIDKIEKGTSGLYYFGSNSFEIMYSLIQLVGSYAVLVYFSRPAAIIVLLTILISVWITMRFDTIIIKQYKELNKVENEISESVYDAISNITTVIILRVEKLVFESIMSKVEKPYKLYKNNSVLSEVKWFLTAVCVTSMKVLVLGLYFWHHIGTPKGVLVAEVYLLFSYLDKIGEQFFRFTGMYGDILIRKAQINNSEILSEDFVNESFANHVLPVAWRKLEIQNLTFSYRGEHDENLHLEDINITLHRGERVAFVGESGSGKSTLLKVMRDLYHPRHLDLLVDGVVINEGFSGISRAIALVPQNPEIFATTIIENITLGAEYDLDFVKAYVEMACFSEVVEALPRQFDSSIKEKGVNLSGGQQQRLALSRGLLACHNKDIVLLDEPTSSLDTGNEMKIYKNIFNQFEDKTVVSSIHRLHLLPLFDRIYFFDKGRIIGSGTLRDLLTTCVEFQHLWQQYNKDSQ